MVGLPGPAARLAAVWDPVIPRLGEWMARRPDGLSLAQGMVDWGPPPSVRQAIQDALDGGGHALDRYGSTWGDPALLEVVRNKVITANGLDLQGATVLVTTGSNMAFAVLMQVMVETGDEVILPLPAYFNHVMAVQLAGGVAVPVTAGAVPDPDRLRAAITPRTRAIVTISPNNPSGVVIPAVVLEEINALCAERGLLHISDEAYEWFVHGPVPHVSPGHRTGAAAHTASLYSLSKAYGMAGWRVGYAVVPEALQPALAKVLDTVQICPAALTQRAAAAALATEPSWGRERVATLRPRRAQLLERVARWRDEGLPVRLWVEPDGAFYGLLRVEGPLEVAGHALDSDGVMEWLALEQGVAVVSGRAFGWEPTGAHTLRLSYGMVTEPALAEALERLGAGLRQLTRSAGSGARS